MAKIKGSAIQSTLTYIGKTFGEEHLAKLIATLDRREQDILSTHILPSMWYPMSVLVNLLTAMDTMLGKGDLSLCYECGKFGTANNFNALYKIFYKIGTPSFVISVAAMIWKQFHDSGRAEVVKTQKTEAMIRIYEFDEPALPYCKRVQGGITQSVEMSGGKRVVSTHTKCRCPGDDYCEYLITWE